MRSDGQKQKKQSRSPNCNNFEERVQSEGTLSPQEIELPLRLAAKTFRLERAVCSHGLFMTAPNRWDPISKTLTRPLRLGLADDDCSSSPSSNSVLVSISQPSAHPESLIVRVHQRRYLSLENQEALLTQVSRMLRLSEKEEIASREFGNMYRKRCNGGGDDEERSFHGRVFRSPTFFEDMVKCILFCNCQWSRTLSMAEALCELQSELKRQSSQVSVARTVNEVPSNTEAATEDFVPRTPAVKESRRKLRACRVPSKGKFRGVKTELEADRNFKIDRYPTATNSLSSSSAHDVGCAAYQDSSSSESTKETCAAACLLFGGEDHASNAWVGNFPSPRELANLDEGFLSMRCKLGYRASRILKLSQGVVEGRIQLRELEEASKDGSLSGYSKLEEQLKDIDGFGPFTRANVLMCMGYYHVIPADSETIRHLKQVHAINSTIQTVQRDVEKVYGKCAPYQFLAYWSELWHFYEKRFGKLSQMPCSDYKLITASNMRSERKGRNKRKKTS